MSPAEAAPAAREPEARNDFERQNAASKRLLKEVDQVFDTALTNMAKEVKEFLESAGK